MKPHPVNKLNNFIAGWYFKDENLCDEIIEHFIQSPDKKPGMFQGDYSEKSHNSRIKDSIDLQLNNDKLFNRYLNELQNVVDEYKMVYAYSSRYMNVWGLKEPPNIQYYKPPNGGYHDWHCERSGANSENNRRHLVYMTYLNDVTDGGETEWYYQNLKIKPEKGLTVIWPVDWMFTHRGLRSPTQEKYIATGWYYFKEFI